MIAAMPRWQPIPGAIAIYSGQTRAARRNVRVVAEAVAGNLIVEASAARVSVCASRSSATA
jgi:hypothetical protein